jgi:beta-ureidopropionase / N-carbamoyl-L-amino-acid hydrolase
MWRELEPIGRDARTGGYLRSPFGSAERECAAWYAEEAKRRELEVEYDGQGNAVAWWRPAGWRPAGTTGGVTTDATTSGHNGGTGSGTGSGTGNRPNSGTTGVTAGGAVLIGSHLDSVDLGGAFDGPLGVVSSFAAIDRMREQGVAPNRPVGVAMFVEEEGSRFGIACLGSRLATGRITPEAAGELRDRDGVALLDAMAAAGLEPKLGRSRFLDDVACFVELHVEQGRDLVHRGRPVAMASASWAHGRWRFDFDGESNHAGATAMADRHDPMLTYAMTALAANKQARLADARATFARVAVEPNITNAIPSRVQAWLDARGTEADGVQRLVDTIEAQARDRAGRDGTRVTVTAESVVPTVDFEPRLTRRLSRVLGGVPAIATGAGHDAGILQLSGIPSAMVFVRNPSGISHSPEEYAEMTDCLAGVEALTRLVTELVS